MYFDKIEIIKCIYKSDLNCIYKCICYPSAELFGDKYKKTLLLKVSANDESFATSFEKNRRLMLLSHQIPTLRKIYGIIRNFPCKMTYRSRQRIQISNLSGILLEYISGKNLDDYLDQHILTPADIYQITEQCLRTIKILHQNGIMHRDIKPANIIIANTNLTFLSKKVKPKISYSPIKTPIIKLIDFAFSTNKSTSTLRIGTLLYNAPELHLQQQYNAKSDIYSFAMTFFLMIEGDIPQSIDENISDAEAIKILAKGIDHELVADPLSICRESIWQKYPVLYYLFVNCIRANPTERFSAEDAYQYLTELWTD